MTTTFLNPVVWLLVALLLSALWSVVRGGSAADAWDRVRRVAVATPVLVLLALAAAAGLGSRAVVGYLAPGAYAEEVVAARAFLAERRMYRGDDRAAFADWLREEPPIAEPWLLPGMSTCQAGAFRDRPQYFSSQAHPPALLLASVPVVRVVGGRGLYVVILALTLAALAWTWRVLVREGPVEPRSRDAMLLAVALAGWQPVLAGIRQGDAAILAGALVVAAWSAMRRERWGWGGVLAGVAGAVSLPALGVTAGLVRWPRAFAVACLSVASVTAATVLVTGPMVLVDFGRNVSFTASTYASMLANYAVAGRVAHAGSAAFGAAALAMAAMAVAGWHRARDVDSAFALASLLGLLVAPLAWSQHLVLTWLPLAIVLRAASRGVSPWPLAGWAVLALAVSLPDPAVGWLSIALQPGSSARWPVVPFAVAALWTWLLLVRTRVDAPLAAGRSRLAP